MVGAIVGIEWHTKQGSAANLTCYKGPDGEAATAAYVAARTIADGLEKSGVMGDVRSYKTAIAVVA